MKNKKYTVQYGFICDQCWEEDRVHVEPTWVTKRLRDKSMLNHTKNTNHSMFHRIIMEDIK